MPEGHLQLVLHLPQSVSLQVAHRHIHSTNVLQLSLRIREKFDNGKRRSSSVGFEESTNKLKDASVKL